MVAHLLHWNFACIFLSTPWRPRVLHHWELLLAFFSSHFSSHKFQFSCNQPAFHEIDGHLSNIKNQTTNLSVKAICWLWRLWRDSNDKKQNSSHLRSPTEFVVPTNASVLGTQGCFSLVFDRYKGLQPTRCVGWAPKHRWCIRLIGTKHAGFGWVPRQHSPTIFLPTRWNNGWQRFPQEALSNTCTGNGSHPEVDKVLGSIVTWQLQFVYMLKNMVHLVLLPNIYLHILLAPCNHLKFSDLPEKFKEADVCFTCVGRPLMAVQSTVAWSVPQSPESWNQKIKNGISTWQSTTVNYV